MSTQINPFRERIVRFQREHPLFQTIHPFWTDLFRGRLTIEDIQFWALSVYPISHNFSRMYALVASKCESENALTFLADTIYDETGCGAVKESHPTLFRNFVAAIGVAENSIPVESPTEAGRRQLKFCWDIARHGTFVEGLTLLGLGIERTLPDLFKMVIRSLRRHHGLDAAALKYFTIHTVADVKHGQLATRIVAEHAQTPAEQARVREVLFQFWDLQRLNLDAVYQTVRERREALVSK